MAASGEQTAAAAAERALTGREGDAMMAAAAPPAGKQGSGVMQRIWTGRGHGIDCGNTG